MIKYKNDFVKAWFSYEKRPSDSVLVGVALLQLHHLLKFLIFSFQLFDRGECQAVHLKNSEADIVVARELPDQQALSLGLELENNN